jgi:hypothetical protein
VTHTPFRSLIATPMPDGSTSGSCTAYPELYCVGAVLPGCIAWMVPASYLGSTTALEDAKGSRRRLTTQPTASCESQNHQPKSPQDVSGCSGDVPERRDDCACHVIRDAVQTSTAAVLTYGMVGPMHCTTLAKPSLWERSSDAADRKHTDRTQNSESSSEHIRNTQMPCEL